MNGRVPKFRPDGASARVRAQGRIGAGEQDNGCITPLEQQPRPVSASRSGFSVSDVVRIAFVAATITEVAVAMITGSLDPRAWDPLVRWVSIVVALPMVVAAIAIFEEAFPPTTGGG